MFKQRFTNITLCAIFFAAYLLVLPMSQARAFCRMYISGASDKLYHDATQVVMMREGTKTVLSIRNTYKGPPKDFAMVIPVPVVLQKDHVKVLQDELFQKLDILAAPQLVEYWEQDPCLKIQSIRPCDHYYAPNNILSASPEPGELSLITMPLVKVEAKFKEGEYELVMLSATSSKALELWLQVNKYNIPKGSASALESYVQKGMYFFVAKVDVNKVKFNKQNEAMLSPLRFHYDSDDFSLPVRLGLLNARGMQDLIIHILAKNHRYEVANAKNVTIPTNLIVDQSVKSSFAPFYAALFDYTLAQNPGSVVTEYAWQRDCDSCPSQHFGANSGEQLNYNELKMLGMEILFPKRSHHSINIRETSYIVRGDEPPRVELLRQELALQSQRCGYKHLSTVEVPSASTRFNIEVADSQRTVKVWRSKERIEVFSNETLYMCLKDHLERLEVSALKALIGGSNFTMEAYINVSSSISIRHQPKSSQDWVLTRLHARYDPKTFKDDLIFKTAHAIVGGRGFPSGEHRILVEQGAQLFSLNKFQARYVILYPWVNKLMCKSPTRGIWGGLLHASSVVSPALNVSKPGDKIDLFSVIKSKNAPGLPWYRP